MRPLRFYVAHPSLPLVAVRFFGEDRCSADSPTRQVEAKRKKLFRYCRCGAAFLAIEEEMLPLFLRVEEDLHNFVPITELELPVCRLFQPVTRFNGSCNSGFPAHMESQKVKSRKTSPFRTVVNRIVNGLNSPSSGPQQQAKIIDFCTSIIVDNITFQQYTEGGFT